MHGYRCYDYDLLHLAAQSGDLNDVQSLIKQEYNINGRDTRVEIG